MLKKGIPKEKSKLHCTGCGGLHPLVVPSTSCLPARANSTSSQADRSRPTAGSPSPVGWGKDSLEQKDGGTRPGEDIGQHLTGHTINDGHRPAHSDRYTPTGLSFSPWKVQNCITCSADTQRELGRPRGTREGSTAKAFIISACCLCPWRSRRRCLHAPDTNKLECGKFGLCESDENERAICR